jgi:hypothetical protein
VIPAVVSSGTSATISIERNPTSGWGCECGRDWHWDCGCGCDCDCIFFDEVKSCAADEGGAGADGGRWFACRMSCDFWRSVEKRYDWLPRVRESTSRMLFRRSLVSEVERVLLGRLVRSVGANCVMLSPMS